MSLRPLCTPLHPSCFPGNTFLGNFYLKIIESNEIAIWMEYCPDRVRKLLVCIQGEVFYSYGIVSGNTICFLQEQQEPVFYRSTLLKSVDLRNCQKMVFATLDGNTLVLHAVNWFFQKPARKRVRWADQVLTNPTPEPVFTKPSISGWFPTINQIVDGLFNMSLDKNKVEYQNTFYVF